jgi:GNAT superfamily N-acetyltransferase
MRRAWPADAETLVRTVRLGLETWEAFAPASWSRPPPGDHVPRMRAMLSRPTTWGVMASVAGEPAGHAVMIAGGWEEPRSAILYSLFVRPAWWGTGLAGRLHALGLQEAARRGYRTIRLYTPAGQARARAFYAREGWTLAGRPFDEPLLGLELVEYRRELCSSR